MAVISSVKVKYDKTFSYFTDTGSAKRNDGIMEGSEWIKNGKRKWGDKKVEGCMGRGIGQEGGDNLRTQKGKGRGSLCVCACM